MPADAGGGNLRDAFTTPLGPAILVGAGTGALGFCTGGAVGILRSAYPGIAAAYTGAQFFVLGSSAIYIRNALLTLSAGPHRRKDELFASTAAGAISGAAAGRFWGRMFVLPGGVLFGLIGFGIQRSVHTSQDAPPTERDRRTLMQRIADSRWSPIKTLSNDDYEHALVSKLARIEVEISLVDDKLRTLYDRNHHATDSSSE